MVVNKILQSSDTICRIDNFKGARLEPPATPTEGDRYLVADATIGKSEGSPLGPWVGHVGMIAIASSTSPTGWVYEDQTYYPSQQLVVATNTKAIWRYQKSSVIRFTSVVNSYYSAQNKAYLELQYKRSASSVDIDKTTDNYQVSLKAGGRIRLTEFNDPRTVNNHALVPGSDPPLDKLTYDAALGEVTCNWPGVYTISMATVIYMKFDKAKVKSESIASAGVEYTFEHISNAPGFSLSFSDSGDNKLLYDAGYRSNPAIAGVLFIEVRNAETKRYYGSESTIFAQNNSLLYHNDTRIAPTVMQTIQLKEGDKVRAGVELIDAGAAGYKLSFLVTPNKLSNGIGRLILHETN